MDSAMDTGAVCVGSPTTWGASCILAPELAHQLLSAATATVAGQGKTVPSAYGSALAPPARCPRMLTASMGARISHPLTLACHRACGAGDKGWGPLWSPTPPVLLLALLWSH